MAVQLLRLRAFTAIGLGSIPGQRSKIPQTVWYGQKKEKSQHLGVKAARQRELRTSLRTASPKVKGLGYLWDKQGGLRCGGR